MSEVDSATDYFTQLAHEFNCKHLSRPVIPQARLAQIFLTAPALRNCMRGESNVGIGGFRVITTLTKTYGPRS